MRVFYLAMGCLMLGLCSMAHTLPRNDVAAQDIVPLTQGEFDAVQSQLKREKKDRERKHDKRKHVDDEPDVEPQPIPPIPSPKPRIDPVPDPKFHDVKPTPVNPIQPLPQPKPRDQHVIKDVINTVPVVVNPVGFFTPSWLGVLCVALGSVAVLVIVRRRWF
jgi:hypothetical protein